MSLALSTPEDVLDAIGQGLDIFGSKFPLELAERGHAITFSFGAMKGDAFSCRDINLHDDSYKVGVFRGRAELYRIHFLPPLIARPSSEGLFSHSSRLHMLHVQAP